jgi:hypothetical protein
MNTNTRTAMKDYKITDIEFNDNGNVDDREVVVTLDNGTEIHIVSCYESWRQWGGTTDELWTTTDVADCVNEWLHGMVDEPPAEVYDYIDEEGEEDEDDYDNDVEIVLSILNTEKEYRDLGGVEITQKDAERVFELIRDGMDRTDAIDQVLNEIHETISQG